ncbi:MAG: MFS transporter [Myxococcota bacterium]
MAENTAPTPKAGGLYSHYVLAVLVIVYIFNFIDRNILSILAEDIKADLGITDAQMGFLYGTVFAVFYAVFGIPLARLADVWVRRSLIAGGLVVWSAMTALSGLARSFPVLALCRIGVGIGEASASPAAYSLLSDYYPPERRATVIAIYSAGVFIGAGIGLLLGGYILDTWSAWYPDPSDAPFGLRGWHVAFMVVGVPGILVAAWVRSLREPVRGISEGLVTETHPQPMRVLGAELASVIPPLNLIGLMAHQRALAINGAAALGIAIAAVLLIALTGSVAQWIATGIGVYVTISWAQSLKIRDSATFSMIFGSRALMYTLVAFPSIAFVMYGVGFWTAPLLMRLHGVSATEVGLYIGLGAAAGGLIGATSGGVLADWLKLRVAAGRILIGYICVATMTPAALWMIYTDSLTTAYIMNFVLTLFSSMWAGVPPSTANDLVMPRMRAVAGAYYILLVTFIGLALGPYVMGQMSDLFMASGMSDGEALRLAMALSMLIFIVTIVCLVMARRHLPHDEATRLDRARELGEPV